MSAAIPEASLKGLQAIEGLQQRPAGLNDLAQQLINHSKQGSSGSVPPSQSASGPLGLPGAILEGLAPLVALPQGELNRDHLKWFQRSWYSKVFVVATLPADRLDDFLRGESKKGLTNFIKHRTEPVKPDKVWLPAE